MPANVRSQPFWVLLGWMVLVTLLVNACLTPTPPAPAPPVTSSPPPPTSPPSTPAAAPTPTAPPTATPTPPPPSPTVTPTPTATPIPPSPTPVPVALTPPPFYEDVSHPVTTLASYYNAINRQEYRRAYGYWHTPPQPFDAFAAGFADTTAAVLVTGPYTHPPRSSLRAGVPVYLLAWHKDGSERGFYGCFRLERTAAESAWRIQEATLRPAPSGDVTLLQDACAPWPGLLDETVYYDEGSQPVDTLMSYYNAIIRREYERAYAYWEQPPQPYDAFVTGFADTASAYVVFIPPERIEGAAGSQYAAVPVLIIATHKDGTRPTFRGCFATRRPNPAIVGEVQPWRLYSATVQAIPDNSTDVHQILAARELCP